MAYEALDTLQQTLDQVLKHGDDLIITPPVKQEIVSIRVHAVVLQLNLKHFPNKESIREAATSTHEVIEYLFSDENLSDGGSTEPTVTLASQLRELAEKLESTAGAVMDYIKSKDSVSCIPGPTDSLAVSSSSRPAPTSKDVVVGFEEDLKVIKYRLLDRFSELQVLPIVGTGGIGKTTLAKIVYNDSMTMQDFEFRAWITISQDYSVASIVSNLLAFMKGISEENDVEEEIHKEALIRKYLLYRRYLIVIDDLCSKKAWDDIKMLFPKKKGSWMILTTRFQDVAAYVDSSSSMHMMSLLDAHHSWKLLEQKVFADKDCPLLLKDIGKKIVKDCGGLPLSIVVAAGILSKIPKTRYFWKQFAANEAQLETIISLSYTHLPDYMKSCFLYMASFPEDYEIRVSELINLWIVEGFLKCSNESLTLKEAAEDCLEDLVERSLVLVTSRKFDGKIKSCSLHDIVREFCVKQAGKEKLILPVMDYLPSPILRRHFLPRLVKDHHNISATSYDLLHLKNSVHSSHIRTIICIPKKGYRYVGSIDKFTSLRVLHVLRRRDLWDWEAGQVFDLIHLTYLASNIPSSTVPSTISKLQNLQTLIIYRSAVRLPVEIWRLRQLRHLIALSFDPFPHPEVEALPLENLESLSLATDFVCSKKMVEMIPNIEKMGICYSSSTENFGEDYDLDNLKDLHRLEKLKLERLGRFSVGELEELEFEMHGHGGLSFREFEFLEKYLGLSTRELEELKKHGGLSFRELEYLEKHRGLSKRELERLVKHEGLSFREVHFLEIHLCLSIRQLEKHGGLSFREVDFLEKHGGLSFRLDRPSLNDVFPMLLKSLTLSGWRLPWSDMTIIGSLHNLQVLKLRNYACKGRRWETIDGTFGNLRLLVIDKSNLRYWITDSSHFPRLECLMLYYCYSLIEIPSNIGDIPTLRLIEVDDWSHRLLSSANLIQDRRRDSGNDSFQVRVKCS